MKINKTIAEALAGQVQAKIAKFNEEARKQKVTKLEDSKDVKELTALVDEIKNLRVKINDLTEKFDKKREQFDKKYGKEDLYISTSRTGYGYDVTNVYVSARHEGVPDTRVIADSILVEAAFADGTTTAEEFVEKITKRFI